MSEAKKGPLRLEFDWEINLEFHDAKVSSNGGLLIYREPDEALGLTDLAETRLSELRAGKNTQHTLKALLRQSVYSRLAGYEDTNDAERLRVDPTVRRVVGGLAMSSRNAYLTAEERKVAPLLYAGLTQARQAFQDGETGPARLRQKAVERIDAEPRFRIDYVEVIEPDTIDTPQMAAPGHFIALAAFLGKARLIDNIELQRE